MDSSCASLTKTCCRQTSKLVSWSVVEKFVVTECPCRLKAGVKIYAASNEHPHVAFISAGSFFVTCVTNSYFEGEKTNRFSVLLSFLVFMSHRKESFALPVVILVLGIDMHEQQWNTCVHSVGPNFWCYFFDVDKFSSFLPLVLFFAREMNSPWHEVIWFFVLPAVLFQLQSSGREAS